jgi:hypothetical protein
LPVPVGIRIGALACRGGTDSDPLPSLPLLGDVLSRGGWKTGSPDEGAMAPMSAAEEVHFSVFAKAQIRPNFGKCDPHLVHCGSTL